MRAKLSSNDAGLVQVMKNLESHELCNYIFKACEVMKVECESPRVVLRVKNKKYFEQMFFFFIHVLLGT